jgi:predicted Zn-dependent protease with MMP-like domain
MKREAFEKLVSQALDRIPEPFQAAMKNIAIVIRDRPGSETSDLPEGEEDDELYGFYAGIPLPERHLGDSGTLPDLIFLYQKPLEKDFPEWEALTREIEITLVHEIAHYFGFDEETLEAYGYD